MKTCRKKCTIRRKESTEKKTDLNYTWTTARRIISRTAHCCIMLVKFKSNTLFGAQERTDEDVSSLNLETQNDTRTIEWSFSAAGPNSMRTAESQPASELSIKIVPFTNFTEQSIKGNRTVGTTWHLSILVPFGAVVTLTVSVILASHETQTKNPQ